MAGESDKNEVILCINGKCRNRMNCERYVVIAHLYSDLNVGSCQKAKFDQKGCMNYKQRRNGNL